MKSYFDILRYLTDSIPYEVRRKSSGTEWMLPTFIGVGLGVAAGVGIGMLLAPAPGYETRAQLKDKAEQVKAKARLAASRAQAKVSELGHNLENGVDRSFLNEAR